jgi:hypothetical protein
MAESAKEREGNETIFQVTWCLLYGLRFEGPCPYLNDDNCIINGRACIGKHGEILLLPKKSPPPR